MPDELIDRNAFRRLADLVFSASRADHASISLNDSVGGTTRFANNQIVQNVDVRRQTLSVAVAFGQRHGSADTTDLSDAAVRDAVRRAEQAARVCPPDPEYLPPLGPQPYKPIPTYRPETASAGPQRRLAEARTAIELCRAAGIQAAGIVSTRATTVGLAADTGLFAFEPRTFARFSLTAAEGGATGWTNITHRSVDGLGVAERTRIAIEKAKASADPRELPPGRYTVILEPAAVAGLVSPMLELMDARSFDKGTSPYVGKLGREIIDPRLTLANRPDHPDLFGAAFDADGLPSQARTWTDAGVLRQLHYDRFTARQHNVPPVSPPDAPVLSGDAPVARTIGDLIRSTPRAILVTTFWYIRFVNRTDLTLTGMTRDGTFLIEDGRLVGPVINFRFHESPLRALRQVEAFTAPTDATSGESEKMLLPAMRIRDFNFSSVTRF